VRGNRTTGMHGTEQKLPGAVAFPSQVSQMQGGQTKATPGFKIESKAPVPRFQSMLIERFRKALKARGGHGTIGLGRQFRIADDDNSGYLNYEEFSTAARDFGVDLDPQDMQNLFKSIDLDLSGEISYDEFLRVVVGDMNQFRRSLVERAFRKLDANGDGALCLVEFKNHYHATMHPDVRSGKKTEDEVLQDFIDTFELHLSLATGSKANDDDQVTLEEFFEYYNHISVSIDNDAYFDLMISNAWSLEGGSNPANLPYAGVAKKVARVNARDAYRQDHHRNLFGTDRATPFAKGSGQHW
jgi:calcyphosin